MMRQDQPPVALIGLMGAGKSTVARVLGERMGVSVADLDSIVEAEEGRSISAMFEREGEAWFRRRERELLARVLDDRVGVLACGGGIVTEPTAREMLRARCRVVWLDVPVAAAAERLAHESGNRPMLGGAPLTARLRDLDTARRTLYERTAHARVDTAGLDPEGVADAVIAALGRLDPGPPAESHA